MVVARRRDVPFHLSRAAVVAQPFAHISLGRSQPPVSGPPIGSVGVTCPASFVAHPCGRRDRIFCLFSPQPEELAAHAILDPRVCDDRTTRGLWRRIVFILGESPELSFGFLVLRWPPHHEFARTRKFLRRFGTGASLRVGRVSACCDLYDSGSRGPSHAPASAFLNSCADDHGRVSGRRTVGRGRVRPHDDWPYAFVADDRGPGGNAARFLAARVVHAQADDLDHWPGNCC